MKVRRFGDGDWPIRNDVFSTDDLFIVDFGNGNHVHEKSRLRVFQECYYVN